MTVPWQRHFGKVVKAPLAFDDQLLAFRLRQTDALRTLGQRLGRGIDLAALADDAFDRQVVNITKAGLRPGDGKVVPRRQTNRAIAGTPPNEAAVF